MNNEDTSLSTVPFINVLFINARKIIINVQQLQLHWLCIYVFCIERKKVAFLIIQQKKRVCWIHFLPLSSTPAFSLFCPPEHNSCLCLCTIPQLPNREQGKAVIQKNARSHSKTNRSIIHNHQQHYLKNQFLTQSVTGQEKSMMTRWEEGLFLANRPKKEAIRTIQTN